MSRLDDVLSRPDRAPSSADRGLALRAALGRFATGVTVVTAAVEGLPAVGLTVSSFNAVSLDPPLVLWSVKRSSASLAALRSAPGFVVNVLADGQHDLVQRFSRPADDRFAGIDWTPGWLGGPVLAGTLAHFECAHYAEYDGGDHAIIVGRVVAFDTGDGRPLIYWRGRPHTAAA